MGGPYGHEPPEMITSVAFRLSFNHTDPAF